MQGLVAPWLSTGSQAQAGTGERCVLWGGSWAQGPRSTPRRRGGGGWRGGPTCVRGHLEREAWGAPSAFLRSWPSTAGARIDLCGTQTGSRLAAGCGARPPPITSSPAVSTERSEDAARAKVSSRFGSCRDGRALAQSPGLQGLGRGRHAGAQTGFLTEKQQCGRKLFAGYQPRPRNPACMRTGEPSPCCSAGVEGKGIRGHRKQEQ